MGAAAPDAAAASVAGVERAEEDEEVEERTGARGLESTVRW